MSVTNLTIEQAMEFWRVRDELERRATQWVHFAPLCGCSTWARSIEDMHLVHHPRCASTTVMDIWEPSMRDGSLAARIRRLPDDDEVLLDTNSFGARSFDVNTAELKALLRAAMEADRCMADQTSMSDGSFESAQKELERCLYEVES